MTDYTLIIYDGDEEPGKAKNQLFFRFPKDEQERMLSFVDVALGKSKDMIHILITG
jgi:hypothetical protein